MAKNPFNSKNVPSSKQKRNRFDLSFQNNLTMQFGTLYPVFCKEVIPGDSFRIKPTFALRFMPMVFPVQTRMRAHLHFFYVKNRYLWDGWSDFIFKTENQAVDATGQPVTPEGCPYLEINPNQFSQMFGTSKIVDYMGIPTTKVSSNQGSTFQFSTPAAFACGDSGKGFNYYAGTIGSNNPIPSNCYVSTVIPESGAIYSKVLINNLDLPDGTALVVPDSAGQQYVVFNIYIGSRNDSYSYQDIADYLVGAKNIFKLVYNDGVQTYSTSITPNSVTKVTSEDKYGIQLKFDLFVLAITKDFNKIQSLGISIQINNASSPYLFHSSSDSVQVTVGSAYDTTQLQVQPVVPVDFTSNECPFGSVINDTIGKLPTINALPFRAYEMIYNSFYRDSRNNPYYLNGLPCYNKFIPSTAGGADGNVYSLRRRNWEQDFLTTAVTNPQFGPAPLVGITNTGAMTFSDDSGNEYKAQATFAEDGETITGFSVQSPDMPQGTLRALVDLASSGISINDLRNVNALQRYLEKTLRRGLMYKDQLENHFGVRISSDVMQLPEFIGGVSRDISVNQINQTTPTSDAPLGSYAGQAYCLGEGHSVSCFCPEHGFIIGILSIAPMANYSQLMPKMFYKGVDALDYYTPEFAHIGMQPIPYSEVCPVNAFVKKGINDYASFAGTPFGYQRAWYDYLASVDEVHGMFRTNLRNFLVNRVFQGVPELSKAFLTVDPSQLNDIFNVPETNEAGNIYDKILGQVYFEVTAKRPIPMYSVPSLE